MLKIQNYYTWREIGEYLTDSDMDQMLSVKLPDTIRWSMLRGIMVPFV